MLMDRTFLRYSPCLEWGTWSDQPSQECVWLWEEEARNGSSPDNTHIFEMLAPTKKATNTQQMCNWTCVETDDLCWPNLSKGAVYTTSQIQRSGVSIQSRFCWTVSIWVDFNITYSVNWEEHGELLAHQGSAHWEWTKCRVVQLPK